MPDLCLNDFSTLITISEPAGVADGLGGLTNEWTIAWELWAKVMPGSGSEKQEAARQESRVKYKMYVQWEPDVKPTNKMRVSLVNPQGVTQYFNIRTVVDVDFKHEFLLLECEEGVEI